MTLQLYNGEKRLKTIITLRLNDVEKTKIAMWFNNFNSTSKKL